MDVLLANEITPDELVSTTAPERLPGQVEWSDQAWPIGSVVTRTATRRVYRAAFAVQAGYLTPEAAVATGAISRWLDIGPMNKWSMFDGQVGTQTENDGDLVVVLRPGMVTSIWLGNLSNVSGVSVVVLDRPGGVVVYDESVDSMIEPVSNWWDYWFAPFKTRSDVTFSNIPAYPNCEVTITVKSGGALKIGMAAIGIVENLGKTLWGPETEFRNYSARTLDQTWGPSQGTGGVVTRDQTYEVAVDPDDAPRVSKFMESAMRRPAVWIPTGLPKFEGIRVFGQAVDGRLSYPTINITTLNISIRGFI